MPATSTEDWTGSYLRNNGGNWEAGLAWKVVGATSETEALDAIPEPGTLPIVRIDNSHPQNGAMLAKSVVARRSGYGIYTVSADFAIPPNGTFTTGGRDDLLRQAPRITMQPGVISVPADRDLRNAPIVNAAGDAYSPPQMRNLRVKHLKVTRYEPLYNYLFLSEFEQSWNTKDMKIGGVTFYAGDVLCEAIGPEEEFAADYKDSRTPWLKIGYNFIILRDWRLDPTTGQRRRIEFPWATYLLNAGRRAWFTDGAGVTRIGELYYEADSNHQINEDVRLDADGKPIDLNLKASATGKLGEFYAPVANPKKPKLQIAPFSTSDACFLRWDLMHEMNHLDLGL